MTKRVTITDIANELALSVCTVNKALTGKPRVSERTRARVIETATRMGYKPNRLAQSLARKPFHIGLVYPDAWPSYYGPLVDGVKQSLAEFRDHRIRVQFLPVPWLHAGDHLVQAIQSLVEQGIDGLIVCPGFEQRRYTAAWRILEQHHIPFILLGWRVPDSPCLTCVQLDAKRCGMIAAELLDFGTGGGSVAILVGSQELQDHRDKVDGFKAVAGRKGFRAYVYEMFDDPEEARYIAEKLLAEHPEVAGLYIATDNSVSICRMLIEKKLSGKVKVVATGTFPEIRQMMTEGAIQVSLFQQMERQGHLAFLALYDYLSERISPEQTILVPPLVVLPSGMESN